jgi:solute carrier family 25 (mitochondrial uncoupling protein), member 8/9
LPPRPKREGGWQDHAAHPILSPLICCIFSQICTIPLDTAKVRLQLQKNVVAAAASGDAAPALPKYRGLLGTAATIAREEGAAALWKGIVPGLHRQCIYGGLRIGLYEPVRSSPQSTIYSAYH